MKMKQQAIARQALHNATTNQSMTNYATILEGLSKIGIPMQDIKPRDNVFTFHAWKALNRHVKKGEKGVKILTWKKYITKEGEEKMRPDVAYVFHISQTEVNQ
jgi:antirestriction protein ArdC